MNRLLHRRSCRGLKILIIIAAVIAALVISASSTDVPPMDHFFRGVIEVFSQVLPKSTDEEYITSYEDNGPIKRPILGWLPDELVEIKRNNFINSTYVYLKTPNNKHLTIMIERLSSNIHRVNIYDTEDSTQSIICVNKKEAVLTVADNSLSLSFFIDNYSCSLYGNLSSDLIIKIAENLKIE